MPHSTTNSCQTFVESLIYFLIMCVLYCVPLEMGTSGCKILICYNEQ